MAAFVESMLGGGAGLPLDLLGCRKYVVDEFTFSTRAEMRRTFLESSLKEIPRFVFLIAENYNYSAQKTGDFCNIGICNFSLHETGYGAIEYYNMYSDNPNHINAADAIGMFGSAAGNGYLFSADDDYYFQAGVTYKMISAV